MSAILLDGRALSERLAQEQAESAARLKARGVTAGLAVILAGDNPASEIYVRNKRLACERAGICSRTVRLPGDASQEAMEREIDALNADNAIHGILVQLPLPTHLDEKRALLKIKAEKDADGFHLLNAGKLFTGADGVVACTPKGILYMLKSADVPLCGKHAVIVGRSNIVGKPMAMLLLGENCTVTVCHSKTQDLPKFTRDADILIAAVGRPRFITADMVKPGAAVVDVGINRVDGKVVGDVDFDAVKDIAGYISPVPGGVGKMTIAMLLQNTLEAAWKTLR